MSSTTAVQLTELQPTPSSATQRRVATSQDEALQASLAADANVPDGGYGWVVVASGAVLLWWSIGMTYAWGVMQAALVEDGLSKPATLSFIGSLQAALVSALAIVNSKLMRSLGARCTLMLAVALMGGSQILAGFAIKSVGGLFFTSGVLSGIGVGLSFTVSAAVPAQYFSKKRGLANGLLFAGGGFGGAANSFILDALIQKLGTAWAYRICGILTLTTGLPAAWLMKERTSIARRGLVEWRLFKSLNFDLVFLGSSLGTFPLFVPPFFIPMYAKSMGFSSSVGATLVAGFSIASGFGRIGSGVACDKLGSLNTLTMSLFLTAITMLAVWPASTSLPPLIAFVVINGAANGAFFSTMPTAVSNVFGSARLAIAMGMIVTGWLGGYLMGSPIAGYLLEAYGGTDGGLQAYRPAMFYAGSLALASGVLIMTARLRLNRSLLARI